MRKEIRIVLMLLLAVLSACESVVDDPGLPADDEGFAPAEATLPAAGTFDRETPLPESTLPPTIRPSATAAAPVTGEAPDALVEAIKDDLSRRSGMPAETITVIRAEEAIWSDGSLGCPRPGEVYTQAPVTGYWIVLNIGDRAYDYRVDDRERFFLCETPQLPGREAPTG